MKHEKLVYAISNIDEDLITESHTAPETKVLVWKRAMAAAACFVLILSSILLLMPGANPVVTAFGNKITSDPVVISESNAVSVARLTSKEQSVQFAVPLNIELDDKTDIAVLSGTLRVFDSSTNSLIYEGSSFSAENDITVIWIVEADKEHSSFKMTVNSSDSQKVINLDYNGCEWAINSIDN